MNRPLRALAVAALAGLALLLGTAPALAHTQFLGSDPPDGASLDTPPERVSLTFNENVPGEFAAVTVVGPDGAQWQTGEVTTADGVVSTELRPLGPAGGYEVGYRVVSDDGHPVTGSTTFTLTAAGPAATPTTPADPAPETAPPPPVEPAASEDEPGAPVWPWVLGAVVLIGGGVAAALRLGRA